MVGNEDGLGLPGFSPEAEKNVGWVVDSILKEIGPDQPWAKRITVEESLRAMAQQERMSRERGDHPFVLHTDLMAAHLRILIMIQLGGFPMVGKRPECFEEHGMN